MNTFKTYGLSIKDFIDYAMKEDIGNGDHTSLATVPSGLSGKAIVKVKQSGIVCGLILADQIFNQIDSTLTVKVNFKEGERVVANDIVLIIEGSIQSILKAERLVLNCMQRMSGIATTTRKFVDEVAGTGVKILDTRKTTPNFRMFEKWAVLSGGGTNHRFGLYDMILIKNNHVDACGNISEAIRNAKNYNIEKNLNLPIEVETRSLSEVDQVLYLGGINRIMLDNFPVSLLKEAVELINKNYETEASGGITLDNIKEYALTGVDFISVGALTHSYSSLDISLNILS